MVSACGFELQRSYGELESEGEVIDKSIITYLVSRAFFWQIGSSLACGGNQTIFSLVFSVDTRESRSFSNPIKLFDVRRDQEKVRSVREDKRETRKVLTPSM
jgi:hypothetical protein